MLQFTWHFKRQTNKTGGVIINTGCLEGMNERFNILKAKTKVNIGECKDNKVHFYGVFMRQGKERGRV